MQEGLDFHPSNNDPISGHTFFETPVVTPQERLELTCGQLCSSRQAYTSSTRGPTYLAQPSHAPGSSHTPAPPSAPSFPRIDLTTPKCVSSARRRRDQLSASTCRPSTPITNDPPPSADKVIAGPVHGGVEDSRCRLDRPSQEQEPSL